MRSGGKRRPSRPISTSLWCRLSGNLAGLRDGNANIWRGGKRRSATAIPTSLSFQAYFPRTPEVTHDAMAAKWESNPKTRV